MFPRVRANGSWVRSDLWYSVMSGCPRIPGALDITWASPCGNTMMSPAWSRIGCSSNKPPQQKPIVTI